LDVLFNSNPSIKVILVEQPVDSIDYPEMKKPFERAIGILRKVSSTHENVQTVNVYEAITDAQKEGKKVWMAAYADPVHFSRKGNEIIAEVLTEHLLSSSAYP
jgi:lysophospholipase L1-like esterase